MFRMSQHPRTPDASSQLALVLRWGLLWAWLISGALVLLGMAPIQGALHLLAAWLVATSVPLVLSLLLLLCLHVLSSVITSRAEPQLAVFEGHSWGLALRTLVREAWAGLRVFVFWQPFAWRDLPDSASENTHDPRTPVPVVLIHGYGCNRGVWRVWMRLLRARKHPFIALNLEPVLGSIDDYTEQIEWAVTQAAMLSPHKPWLVCHSMGGLAARAWLARQSDAHNRVAGLVTLGTPHRGTWLARWGWGQNTQEMQMQSRWLARLEQSELTAKGLLSDPERVLSVYAPMDQIVFPVSTAILPGSIPWRMPGHGHMSMVLDEALVADCLAWMAARQR